MYTIHTAMCHHHIRSIGSLLDWAGLTFMIINCSCYYFIHHRMKHALDISRQDNSATWDLLIYIGTLIIYKTKTWYWVLIVYRNATCDLLMYI